MRLAPFWEDVAETLTGEEVYSTAGYYTITADHKPIVAPILEVPGLYISGGYSGHGIMAAPDASRRLVDMILGKIAPEDNPFCVERLSREISMHEKMVMGSYYGTARPHIDFPRLINLYKAGKLKLDELVSRTYPLEQVNEAFAALANGEVARSVLTVGEA